jgi:hypothetical protein
MPNCNHDHSVIYFHSRCHPQGAIEAKYVKISGQLEMNCRVCGKHIGTVQVANKVIEPIPDAAA